MLMVIPVLVVLALIVVAAGIKIVPQGRAGSNSFCMVIVDKKYTKQG